MSDTFCPMPWAHISVKSNGDYRLCCHANQGPSRGLITDENNKPLNIDSTSMDEAINSTMNNEVRLSMLAGEKHPECTRCWTEEHHGIRSRRIYDSEIYKDVIDINKAKEITNQDGTLNLAKFRPVYYDFRMGNVCNLKCRMCGPQESNTWYQDIIYDNFFGNEPGTFNDTHGLTKLIKNDNGKLVADNNKYNWPEENIAWNELEKNISNIRHLFLAGGEPLMIQKHYDFLEKCVSTGFSKNIILEYNTNATVSPLKAYEYWKHFKELRIKCSIDAYDKINQYIRYPSDWNRIVNNYKAMQEMNCATFMTTSTIMVYNIFNLQELIQWVFSENESNIRNKSTNSLMAMHLAHGPKQLNIRTLPNEAKKMVQYELDETLKWLFQYINSFDVDAIKYYERMHTTINNFSKYMWSEDWSNLWKKTIIFTKKLDNLRNQHIKNFIPKLWPFMEKEYNDL